MKESLTGRVGRIISGSANALVGALESMAPELVMEEAIRDIDGVMDDVRAELGRQIANKHLASTRLMDENRKHTDLAGNIELAVSEGRDDLAEAAIAVQLDIEAQRPVLESTIADCSVSERELEGYVRALQAKKREMQEDVRRFRESRQQAAAAFGTITASENAGAEQRVEKAGNAFDRVMERATGMSAAGSPVDRKHASQLAELEDLAHHNRVRERLEAVKRQVKGE